MNHLVHVAFLRLLESFLAEPDGKCDVVIPMVGEAYRLLPYFRSFFEALGLMVRVVRPDRAALLRGVQRCHSSDVCCPIKIAHGLLRGEDARMFLPKVLEVSGGPGAGGSTCAMKQALPEMIEQDALDRGESIRVIRPVMNLGQGLETREVCRAWSEVTSQLGIEGRRVRAAIQVPGIRAGCVRPDERREPSARLERFGRQSWHLLDGRKVRDFAFRLRRMGTRDLASKSI